MKRIPQIFIGGFITYPNEQRRSTKKREKLLQNLFTQRVLTK